MVPQRMKEMIFTKSMLMCVMHHVEDKLTVPKAIYIHILGPHDSVTLYTKVIKSAGGTIFPIR